MSLLEDIQNAAVDTNGDLGSVLRNCKLLAARLGSKPLEDWLIWESNGYPTDVEVPEYRIWPLELKGHFEGPFGSGLRNAPVPLICLPKYAREYYERYRCRDSVAGIEALLCQAKDGWVQVTTGDLAVALGMKVYQGQNCIHAWGMFGTGRLVELLNSVRNRILDFALAVWKEQPGAGELAKGTTKPMDSSRVTQIFNTTVYGGAAQLVGTATNSPISFSVHEGDFPSVERVLRENGVPQSDLSDLRSALEADEGHDHNKGFGPKVSAWIGKMMNKAADRSWEVGLNVAGTILTQVLMKYYGLH